MEKTKKPVTRKRQYKKPNLTTHGNAAKLTRNPKGPKSNGRWSWVSDLGGD